MNVMRFTVIAEEGVISFVAPWNALKALAAACSSKPTPNSLITLIEAASKYDTGLKKYVFDNLAIFDENHARLDEPSESLNPLLEKQLIELLATTYQTSHSNFNSNSAQTYLSAFGEIETSQVTHDAVTNNPTGTTDEIVSGKNTTGQDDFGENDEITYEELGRIQREIVAKAEAYHPVFRVTNPQTLQKSQEAAGAGLIIFNLKAKRIIQVQNSFAPLQRSDRGRYHEDGRPTERLFFYRLPTDWSIVP